MSKRSRPLKNIIWVQTAFLGDIVLTTAAISLAKKSLTGVKQFLITTPVGGAALNEHPYLEHIFTVDKKKTSLWAQARLLRASFKQKGIVPTDSVILQVHQSFRSSLLVQALGITSITYSQSSLSFLATQRRERIAVFHESARIGLLLEGLGIDREKVVSSRPWLPALASSEKPWGQTLCSASIAIGIAPGSTWATKQWKPEYYSALAVMLLKHPQVSLFFLGSNAESSLVSRVIEDVKEKCGSKRLVDLSGETNFDDLRFIYPRLSLVIANDSSPIHYASSFNTPTVAIFGATSPKMGFGPLASRSEIVEKAGLSCRPCGAHGPNRCPLGHFRCMEDLAPKIAYDACRRCLPELT